jgi:hypothetical protein
MIYGLYVIISFILDMIIEYLIIIYYSYTNVYRNIKLLNGTLQIQPLNYYIVVFPEYFNETMKHLTNITDINNINNI